jgi:outer membrane lipase/esterase
VLSVLQDDKSLKDNVLSCWRKHCLLRAATTTCLETIMRYHPAWSKLGLFTAGLSFALSVQASAFSNLFVFGDSLSDSGNNAAIFSALSLPSTPVPVSGNDFIPSLTYSSGTYSNGPVWVTPFSQALGLAQAGLPSLAGGGNFAYGGATSSSTAGGTAFTPGLNMQNQVQLYLATPGTSNPNALFVLAGGGNNVRNVVNDAGAALANGANFATVASTIIAPGAAAYAADIISMVSALKADGAQNIVVWNAPNAGRAPALIANGAAVLGETVSAALNQALNAGFAQANQASPGFMNGVWMFDLFSLVGQIATDPAFGFTNLTDACAANPACVSNPGTQAQYLFWDGIHPTSAAHQVIANAMIALVPVPGSLWLIVIGVAAVGVARRQIPNAQ